MKKTWVIFLLIFLAAAALCGCSGKRAAANARLSASVAGEVNQAAVLNMLDSYAARDFISGEVSSENISAILECGAWAPSARNGQPWHFTVLSDLQLSKKIISNMIDGNVIMIVSAPAAEISRGSAVLDCGLATQNIYLAAQALGLGSRIYTGPIADINKNHKADLGIPSGYDAVALVRIGHIEPPADGVSSASGRKELSSLVNYR
ncbi:nitroreductase family protein [Breznakiella homolactica]|uniref:Nitroreductase family protein n=1 Tax=Breznakiella homolactica TaxID=2798577 RepID=A0A7T7XPU4_9SPIR|nr:nitroreductase family protein [Breznakiella homolactica]QQO10272.1 nitroreductase family protein [Breznakiella homolactica]